MTSKCTVLMLAEDAHLYRKLGRVLEQKGCRVLRGATQVEAIHIRQFDLILAQVNAPKKLWTAFRVPRLINCR